MNSNLSHLLPQVSLIKIDLKRSVEVVDAQHKILLPDDLVEIGCITVVGDVLERDSLDAMISKV